MLSFEIHYFGITNGKLTRESFIGIAYLLTSMRFKEETADPIFENIYLSNRTCWFPSFLPNSFPFRSLVRSVTNSVIIPSGRNALSLSFSSSSQRLKIQRKDGTKYKGEKGREEEIQSEKGQSLSLSAAFIIPFGFLLWVANLPPFSAFGIVSLQRCGN